MVKGDNSWLHSRHSSWQPPDLSCINALIEPRRQQLPLCINSGNGLFATNAEFPGFAVPDIPSWKTDQANELRTLLHLPPHFQSSLVIPNLHLKENQYDFPCRLGVKAIPNAIPMSFQKRFFIFDQCQNQARLVYSSVDSHVENPYTASTKLEGSPDLHKEEQEAKVDQVDPARLILQEESDLNQICGEESEMHEDTEEINALLYSDEDDDDDYSGDDEVTSTDRSPVVLKRSYEKQENFKGMSEGVASSDGPSKRQKLPNGGYKFLSSLMDTASSMMLDKTHKCNNDAESSYVIGTTKQEDIGSVLGKKQSRKDKIRGTLKLLESMIPDGKGKDPLVVLDEAINYLKSLKIKAKALGVNYY